MEDVPDELLADIVRRLPPRWIASCRSVCKHWRAAVDARGLLLAVAHLVPCSLRGIFTNYIMERSLGFFSRARAEAGTTSSQLSNDATLSFLPGHQSGSGRYRAVLDHRGGLLLYENGQEMYVCNPATRRWATLTAPPRVPAAHSHLTYYRRRMYLMFDPTVSLHYDVLFFPDVLDKPTLQQPGDEPERNAAAAAAVGSMEWPPYMYPVQMFSSRTSRWEEKQFIRRGDAAVTVSDVMSDRLSPVSSRRTRRNHAVFWRASFYVHCDIGFIMRLSLEEQKYLVIKTPEPDTTGGHKTSLRTHGYLGKSKHGVYYTAVHGYQLHMWVLHDTLESSQPPEWEMKHHADLEPSFKKHYNRHFRGEKIEKCWILDNSRGQESEDRGDYEWDSSDDTIVEAEGELNRDYKDYYFPLDFLGYHPWKEIAFLGNHFQGFAYYLDNSKLQYLGLPYPSYLKHKHNRPLLPMLESFTYTPCMDDLLPIQNDA